MFWAQGLAAFALWIAYGLWVRKRGDRLRNRMRQTPRKHRMLYGSVGFIVSGMILFGGLLLTQATGQASPQGFTLLGWLMMAASGLAFVHLQILAAAAMITMVQDSETRPPSDPSKP